MPTLPPPHRNEHWPLFQLDSPLLKYQRNVASQRGEDGVIERIFQIIPPRHRFFVEFGAWDGRYMSNCWNLAANMGWGGTFIECNARKFQDLLGTHGANPRINCVNRMVGFEGADSLDDILAATNTPQDFDLLSIDVDGTDYFIWESLTRYSPHLVIIEFNPTIPNDVLFIQAKSAAVNHGCSLLSLIVLGKEKGYELVVCTEWNAFFVRKEHYDAFQLRSNFIHHLYRPYVDGRIFQGYDSYIHIAGMDKLVWHGGKTISSDDVQVLPEHLRRYSDSQHE